MQSESVHPRGPVHVGKFDIPLLVEALLTLAFASAAIRCLPFRTVVRKLVRPPATPPATNTDPARLSAAVQAWARRVPWKVVCFQIALCLYLMLRRRGHAPILLYGIRKRADSMDAHVWLSLHGEDIVGAEQAGDFACVARFPSADAPL